MRRSIMHAQSGRGRVARTCSRHFASQPWTSEDQVVVDDTRMRLPIDRKPQVRVIPENCLSTIAALGQSIGLALTAARSQHRHLRGRNRPRHSADASMIDAEGDIGGAKRSIAVSTYSTGR